MKLKYIIILFVFIAFIFSNNNINISSKSNLHSIPTIVMPYIDNNQELIKDEGNVNQIGIPLRFAVITEVNINTSNSGKWFSYNEDYDVWKLNIISTDAIGLKLLFDEFHLTKNAILYIYNQEQDMIVGPLTNKNNHEDNTFGHKLLKGDAIYLEYFIPKSYNGTNQLRISNIIHAYRDIHGYYEDRDRDCGGNVACSDADPYEDQVNSVIFLEMNQYICSAVLVNNTSQDLTPYVLTAWHCVEEDTSLGSHNNFTFYFRHQSSSCGGSGGNYGYSESGSYTRAWDNLDGSDFALLEMDDDPPSYFNPYFAGWSRYSSSPQISVGIHHPGGEGKKINYDNNDTAYSCSWYSGSNHWCFSWDEGGTAGGSSGSPVFNNNNQIVGQLSGGTGADCGNGTDYYGRFNKSWSNGNNSSTRLSDWLDPWGTSSYTLDGTYDGDCEEDCAGECDGDAVEDQCGICDSNPNNDCVQDCNGNWGGSAVEDNCGTCDSNSNNDCVQDCNGNWGGITEDSDSDGVCSDVDSDDNNPYQCSDIDNDNCDDCYSGSFDPANDGCNLAEINFETSVNSTNELGIHLSHQVSIAGFQFNIVDEPNCIVLESAYGGEAENEAFTVNTNENNGYGIVLGFSMSGAIIPAGNHIITNLVYSGTGDCEACIENVTISDMEGNVLSTEIGQCITIENSLLGDISLDGEINVIDVVILVNNILNVGPYDELGDMNQDGIINVIDVVILVNIILN